STPRRLYFNSLLGNHMDTTYPTIRIGDPDRATLHAYYDVCPESPDGSQLVCFSFDDAVPGPGRIETRQRDGSGCQIHGRCHGIGHVGGFTHWHDNHTLAWVDSPDAKRSDSGSTIANLATGTQHALPGRIRQFHLATRRGLVLELGDEPNPHALWRTVLITDDHGRAQAQLDLTRAAACHPDQDRMPPISELNVMNAKWCPDGSHFLVVLTDQLFCAATGARPRRIKCLVMADATGNEVQFLGDFSHHPAWTPDGAGVIAYRTRAEGDQDLLRYHLDGRAPELLIAQAPGTHASMAADQRSIVTDVMRDGGGQIVRLDLTQNGAQEVLANFTHGARDHLHGHHPHPVFSHDGSRVYFNAADDGICALYALELG
ncbi:MAG: hypothetical protein PF961_18105, partial [Planctomycetota bacterium]|nr:hypothetical protein [Planctomycetota bacterium]